MITHLDSGVGRIVAALEELGHSKDTLVIFTSDNGPTGPGSAGPFRGGKGTLFEGGLRVPFIVCWPDRIAPGSVIDRFAMSTDVLPTLCEAVELDLPTDAVVDGQSVLPDLLGEKSSPTDRAAFWKLREYPVFQHERGEPKPYATEACRKGSWKLLAHKTVPLALYNIDADPKEQHNRLAEEPGVAGNLVEELRAWLAQMQKNASEKRGSWHGL
jgi:arylsulfatase A-like enzyme